MALAAVALVGAVDGEDVGVERAFRRAEGTGGGGLAVGLSGHLSQIEHVDVGEDVGKAGEDGSDAEVVESDAGREDREL